MFKGIKQFIINYLNYIIMQDLYLSGAVGVTVLVEKDNLLNNLKKKETALYHDVHTDNIYCKNSVNHIKVAEWLEEKSKDNVIKLEEIDGQKSGIKLTDLWTGAEHTRELKKLAQKNIPNLDLVDIRPFLIPWSWELMKTDKSKFGKIIFSEYLNLLKQFFNKDNSSKSYNLFVKNIKFINKDTENKCIEHLNDLKDIFNIFLVKNKHLLKKSLKEIYKLNINILYEINNILSAIMEWFTILKTVNTKLNSIIHVGLAHSTRIKKLLIKYYNYSIKYEDGLTNLNQFMIKTDKKINACVLLPKNISEIFSSTNKFGIHKD